MNTFWVLYINILSHKYYNWRFAVFQEDKKIIVVSSKKWVLEKSFKRDLIYLLFFLEIISHYCLELSLWKKCIVWKRPFANNCNFIKKWKSINFSPSACLDIFPKQVLFWETTCLTKWPIFIKQIILVKNYFCVRI